MVLLVELKELIKRPPVVRMIAWETEGGGEVDLLLEILFCLFEFLLPSIRESIKEW